MGSDRRTRTTSKTAGAATSLAALAAGTSTAAGRLPTRPCPLSATARHGTATGKRARTTTTPRAATTRTGTASATEAEAMILLSTLPSTSQHSKLQQQLLHNSATPGSCLVYEF